MGWFTADPDDRNGPVDPAQPPSTIGDAQWTSLQSRAKSPTDDDEAVQASMRNAAQLMNRRWS